MAESARQTTSRRDFIRGASLLIGGLIGAVIGLPSIAYLLSPVSDALDHDAWIDLGPADGYPNGTPTLIEFTQTRTNGWERTAVTYGAFVVRVDDFEAARILQRMHAPRLPCELASGSATLHQPMPRRPLWFAGRERERPAAATSGRIQHPGHGRPLVHPTARVPAGNLNWRNCEQETSGRYAPVLSSACYRPGGHLPVPGSAEHGVGHGHDSAVPNLAHSHDARNGSWSAGWTSRPRGGTQPGSTVRPILLRHGRRSRQLSG